MNHTRQTRALLLALGIGGLAAAALAPQAHADPIVNYAITNGQVVCEALDDYPTLVGIERVGRAVVADTGWSYTQAGSVIVTAIQLDCSRYLPLWNTFVATYGPNSVTGPNPAPAPAPVAPEPRQRMQEAA